MLSARRCLGAPVSIKQLGIQGGFPFPLSLRKLLAARGCRDTSPLGPGPFKAGFRILTNIPQSFQGWSSTLTCADGIQHVFQSVSHVNAIVYYPATVEGENAPIAGGRPFPLIIYGHARRLPPECGEPICPGSSADISRDFEQLSGIFNHLARWGFVTIAPDLSWLAPNVNVESRLVTLSDVLAALLAESAFPFSPFWGLIKTSRLGALGYSTSGLAPILLFTEKQFPIGAAALLAPAGNADAVNLQRFSPRPILVIDGTNDTGTAGASGSPAAIYNRAMATKYRVTIGGANHFGYTDNICLQPNLDGIASISQADQQTIANAYLTAFFRRYLNDETDLDEYLLGLAPVEELKGFDITIRAEIRSVWAAMYATISAILSRWLGFVVQMLGGRKNR